jgi:sugar phosphate permease
MRRDEVGANENAVQGQRTPPHLYYHLARLCRFLILPQELEHCATGFAQRGEVERYDLGEHRFAYSLPYAVGQFVCGLLSDPFGRKKVVGVGLISITSATC